MDYTIQSLITFIFFIMVIWSIYQLARKESVQNFNEETLELQPKPGGGWLYAIERDGYIKIGRSNYKQVESSDQRQKSLENRIEDYVNPTETPYTYNTNIIYFHYFENLIDCEKQLITYLNTFTPTWSDSNITKYDDYWLHNVPQKKEWFKYNCEFKTIKSEIIEWFSERCSTEQYVKEIMEETLIKLHNQNRIFIHQIPEA